MCLYVYVCVMLVCISVLSVYLCVDECVFSMCVMFVCVVGMFIRVFVCL